jgi:hypothetical protein
MKQATHPTFRKPTRQEQIDAAMLADKKQDGYWKRAVAAAMASQIQTNGRES